MDRQVNVEENSSNYKELYLQRNGECLELRKEIDNNDCVVARMTEQNYRQNIQLQVYKEMVDKLLDKRL